MEEHHATASVEFSAFNAFVNGAGSVDAVPCASPPATFCEFFNFCAPHTVETKSQEIHIRGVRPAYKAKAITFA
jgi:hypothetical protein